MCRDPEQMGPSPRHDVHNFVATPAQCQPAPAAQIVAEAVHGAHRFAHSIDGERQVGEGAFLWPVDPGRGNDYLGFDYPTEWVDHQIVTARHICACAYTSR